MKAEPKRRFRSQRYTSPEFKPYVAALGQLALAWNDLQESLKGLFWTLMNPPPQAGDFVNYTPLWVWSAIRSDRSQREMLKAVVDHPPEVWGAKPRLTTDIGWLVNEAERLENARNDAIHSPLFASQYSIFGLGLAGGRGVAPASWLFNPRAVSLSKRKDLLSEFRYCRDRAVKLSDYAQAIDRALVNPRNSWPRRPVLPTRRK